MEEFKEDQHAFRSLLEDMTSSISATRESVKKVSAS